MRLTHVPNSAMFSDEDCTIELSFFDQIQIGHISLRSTAIHPSDNPMEGI